LEDVRHRKTDRGRGGSGISALALGLHVAFVDEVPVENLDQHQGNRAARFFSGNHGGPFFLTGEGEVFDQPAVSFYADPLLPVISMRRSDPGKLEVAASITPREPSGNWRVAGRVSLFSARPGCGSRAKSDFLISEWVLLRLVQ
jgi:hypothetical protein